MEVQEVHERQVSIYIHFHTYETSRLKKKKCGLKNRLCILTFYVETYSHPIEQKYSDITQH